jgi:hypothetical protein
MHALVFLFLLTHLAAPATGIEELHVINVDEGILLRAENGSGIGKCWGSLATRSARLASPSSPSCDATGSN